MDRKTRIVSIGCVILAALLCLCGCEAKQTAASHTATSAAVDLSNAEKLGEGDRQFYFTVTFAGRTDPVRIVRKDHRGRTGGLRSGSRLLGVLYRRRIRHDRRGRSRHHRRQRIRFRVYARGSVVLIF